MQIKTVAHILKVMTVKARYQHFPQDFFRSDDWDNEINRNLEIN